MFIAINLGLLLIPAVVVQYTMAIACLLMLVNMRFLDKYKISSLKFWVWNFIILLAIGIGFVAFLVCKLFFAKAMFGYTADKDEKK